ncbi:MAG: C25 family cysteine peptidase, partial [Candidatus Eisenbacteria bacterium]
MRVASWLAMAFVLVAAACPARTVEFPENRGAAGLELTRSSDSFVEISLRLDRISIDDVSVDGSTFQQIAVPGVVLPGDEGAPNLPGFGRFIALPEGAIPRLEILSMKTELLTGIDVLPSAAMPFETDDSPPVYKKDDAIYLSDAPYPADPVRLSGPRNMRGVDVALLGVTPFQYNPVTRELTVIKDVQVRVTFEGGTGTFGDDRLRSRHWEPILEENLINYDSLPEVDLRVGSSRDEEYEYVIVVPDDQTYIAWADSLKRFRTLQGIDTGVVTLTQTGATYTEIEAWIDNAYTTWQTPPVAVLMLADYVTNGGTTGITCPSYSYYSYTCVSDNQYSDVDGDHLPDITFARMTATPTTIETLVRKAIDYERFPSTNQGFYDNPVVACGWQTERWFQVCSEVVYGFLANELGKTPVREYNIYLGTPGTSWSSNPNTYMLVDYFGPGGLGYLPATPEHLTDWNASAARLNADINAGAFIVQHRDHGGETGWGEPDYGNADLAGLSNADLTFVFSINCLTGKFNYGGECFTEAFHRVSPRALGLIAASETSMSFVNDAFVFGIYDMLWPEFDPGYPVARTRDTGSTNLRPGFANASGKYYLEASSWPYNPEDRELTYYLFHMHGDAFTTLYSEMPELLTISHQGVLPVGATTFNITADDGSMVALTVDGEIVAVAEGTGAEMSMPVVPVLEPGVAKLTVTKGNHYRHVEDVLVIYPVTYDITPTSISINRETGVTVTVWDDLGVEKPDVVVTIDGWGIDAIVDTTDVLGEAHFSVLAPYGENLTVVGRTIGENYDCLSDVLPVVDGLALVTPDVTASVSSIGLYGSLTPYYEGLISGTAATSEFTLYATGCGVDESEWSGMSSAVDLRVTPSSTGTIHAAIGKDGYVVYLEDIAVEVVYGQLAGEVYEATRSPVEGARVKGYAAGADTSAVAPVFSELTGVGGAYAVGDDLEVGYYDV